MLWKKYKSPKGAPVCINTEAKLQGILNKNKQVYICSEGKDGKTYKKLDTDNIFDYDFLFSIMVTDPDYFAREYQCVVMSKESGLFPKDGYLDKLLHVNEDFEEPIPGAVYIISGDTFDDATKQAISGFDIQKTTNKDCSMQINLKALSSDYTHQSYTVQPGQKLYFIETSFGDDSYPSGEFNLADDHAVLVDADGYIIK